MEAAPFTKMVVGGSLSRDPPRQKTQQGQRNTNAFCERYHSSGGSVQTFSLPHFINEKEECVCSSYPQEAREQQFPWEVLIRSQALTFPPLYVENSGLGLLAKAMKSSSFVSLPTNVIGYNWDNYGLLKETKHRC